MVLFLWIIFGIKFHVCHAVMSVYCSLMGTCWERANLLSLLYVMFSCVFVTVPCSVLGHLWYLIVLVPDLCLLLYLMSIAYKTIIGPQLGYASIVWSPHTAADINKIKSVQHRAAHSAIHDYRNTPSVTAMLGNLNWRPLD